MWASLLRFTQKNASTSTKHSKPKSELSIRDNLRRLVQKDINATRNEYFIPAPQFLMDAMLSRKRQKKDATLFHCLFNVMAVNVLNLIVIAIKPDLDWRILAGLTTLRIAVFGTPRFVLALHAASHSPVLENESLNHFILNWLMGTFMGIPTGAYPVHHITMHHKEDNLFPLDLSSTMPYQRNRWAHFFVYWMRFEIFAWFELPYWLAYKGFYKKLAQHLGGEFFWWFIIAMSWMHIRPAVSIWIFLAPQVFLSFLLMFGNWSQHIFVDPDDFANDHSLTVNCIDSPYNQATFNDGYHIIHHKYPYLHWKQLPKKFLEESQLDSHAEANSICFGEVDWFWIGTFVMSGRMDLLAEYFVPMNESQARMDVNEIVEFLKRRLVPIRDAQSEKSGKGFNAMFGVLELLVGRD